MKYKCVPLSVLLILCGACQRIEQVPVPPDTLAVPHSTTEPSPRTSSATVIPSPTLHVVSEYVDGFNDLPADTYLWVEYWRESVVIDQVSYQNPSLPCMEEPLCDYPEYWYVDGQLDIYRLHNLDQDLIWLQDTWLIDPGTKTLPFIGFWSEGDSCGWSRIYPIEVLPFFMERGGAHHLGMIHSADNQGGIVVDLGDEAFKLGPGDSWMKTTEYEIEPGCRRSSTTWLRNHGLFRPALILPDGTVPSLDFVSISD